MKYYNELDGLRFIAVFLVILSHWFPKTHFLNYLPNGSIGVTIFFVLSGFLISSILFNYKQKIKKGKVNNRKALAIFYIRRSLRIFPIYYILIIFLYFYGYSTIKENFGYFLTYTSNILMFKNQTSYGTISHLWTLAIEEQFYLFWPFIVLFVRKKFIKVIIPILILIAVFSQFYMNLNFEYYNYLTFNAFDAFGFGSLLAFFHTFEKENLVVYRNILWGLLAVVSLFFILNINFFTSQTLTSILTTLLLIFILNAKNKNSYPSKFLRIPTLRYIGKISYGIYLFHTFIPGFMRNYYQLYLPTFLKNQYFISGVNFGIVILVATVSWYVIESPINSIKKKFKILSRKSITDDVRVEVNNA